MRRRWIWIGTFVGIVLALLVAAAVLVDEPLRQRMERDVNRRLKGYTATIGTLDFHPIGLSVELHDVTLVQQANPDPPVAHFPRLYASVDWRALLRLRIVAEFLFDRPQFYINRAHLAGEAKDEVPVEKRGWQDALQAIYPLAINRFVVRDGEITYVDEASARVTSRAVKLEHINLVARNIRNIASPDHVYPSDVTLEAMLFGEGRLALDGHADFLAEPFPAIRADLKLDGIRLDAFQPVLRRAHLDVRKGVLGAAGSLEYGPHVKVVHVREVTLDNADLDFVHTASAAEKEKKAARTAGKAAREVSNRPDTLTKVDLLRVRDGTFGFVNRAAAREYRVFLARTNLELTNLSNQRNEGTMVAKLTGRFMGTGDTLVTATFRPELHGPDFDANVKVENADMTAMNDLLRAYGKFDVTDGLFSVYSEVKVKKDRIDGYVKPLFSELRVYDPDQDRDKPVLTKLYEKAVQGASKVLRNRPRREVATVADISGPIEDPQTSTWQAVVRLVQNAFFRAILPGFGRQVASRQ